MTRLFTPSEGKDRWWWRWRWSRALGRRGATLLFFGLLDVIIAWSLLTAPPGPNLPPTALLLPVKLWAILWAVVGGFALAMAWAKPPRDALAFALCATVKFLWGFAYLYAWSEFGLYRGWVSTVIWCLFAVHALVTAGWVEPARLDDGPAVSP